MDDENTQTFTLSVNIVETFWQDIRDIERSKWVSKKVHP